MQADLAKVIVEHGSAMFKRVPAVSVVVPVVSWQVSRQCSVPSPVRQSKFISIKRK
jgi:hypothetical protein